MTVCPHSPRRWSPPVELAAEGQTDAAAGPEVHHGQPVDAAPVAEPQLPDCDGLERIVQVDRGVQAEPPLEHVPEGHVAPVPVGSERRHAAGHVHLPGQAHAQAEDRPAAQALPRRLDAVDDVGQDGLGAVLAGVQALLDAFEHGQSEVVDLHLHVRLGHVDTDEHAAPGVGRQQRPRPPAPGVLAPDLDDHAQLDEVGDQIRDGRDAQVRRARQ
ncbi:hypothetical protein GCM10029992_46220 [Glycomyces albus]